MKPTEVVVRASDLSSVVEHMAGLVGTRGWINLTPLVDADTVPARGVLGELFTSRGPDVPMATWVSEPPAVGVRHGSGPKARRRLDELGHPVPADWRVTHDHPRRGLAIEIGGGSDLRQIAAWLLRAAALLSTVPTGDEWLLAVYEP